MAAIIRTSTLIVFGLPSRSNSPCLQHAQQLGLKLERQLADLVEEQRRAVRDLEAPDLARHGPGVRALLPAEQLALHQPGGQRGAVHLDQQAAAAGAVPVDGLGDQLLADAGLAANQHRGARRRHLLHLAQDLQDRGALPGDLAARLDHLDLGLEVVALRLQPVLQPLDLRVRPPQRLLALLALRDVAEHAEGPYREPGGVACGGTAEVKDPDLPTDRVQIAVFDASSSFFPSIACSRSPSTRGASSGCRRSLQKSTIWSPSRSGGTPRSSTRPAVGEHGAGAFVHLDVREAGELGSRRQAGLAHAQRLLGPLALGDVLDHRDEVLRLAGGDPHAARRSG